MTNKPSKYTQKYYDKMLIKCIVIVAVTSLILFSIFAFVIYRNNIKNAKNAIETENNKCYEQISDMLDSNIQICLYFASYKDISPIFQQTSEFDLRKATLIEETKTFISCFDYIASIEIDADEFSVSSGVSPGEEMLLLQDYKSFNINYSPREQWPFFLQLEFFSDNTKQYDVKMNFYVQSLSRQYISDNTYLIASDGTIILARDTNLLWKNISEISSVDYKQILSGGNDANFISNTHTLGKDGAAIITFRDKTSINADAFSQILLFLLIGIFILCTALILIYFFLRKIYGPIEKVAQILKFYMPENVSLAENDVRLIEKFSNQENPDQNVRAAVLQIRKSQLYTLHSQISPHLIGNTLEVIKWEIMKRLGQNNPIEQSLSTLGTFLSEAYQYKRMITTLSDEIERTKLYIQMMTFCFYDNLRVMWDVDKSLLDCSIISLTLQPLIENSVLHGFSDENEEPKIKISIRGFEKNILISVSDNGYGMNKNVLEDIEKSLSDDDISKRHIGLKNTHLKLRYLYGAEYGITEIKSGENGTTIELSIPRYDISDSLEV